MFAVLNQDMPLGMNKAIYCPALLLQALVSPAGEGQRAAAARAGGSRWAMDSALPVAGGTQGETALPSKCCFGGGSCAVFSQRAVTRGASARGGIELLQKARCVLVQAAVGPVLPPPPWSSLNFFVLLSFH